MATTMNARALNRTHASALTLATVVSFSLLTGVACIPGHGVNGPDPEDLTAIAAVLNKTAGPLTVVVSDPPATDILEPDGAIFYEVSQSMEPREFEFQSGDSVGSGSLRLLTGGEQPGFATGVLTVTAAPEQTLVVDDDLRLFPPFSVHREALPAGSSVFLVVNDTGITIVVGLPGTNTGALLDPNEHTAVALDAGATLAVNITAVDQQATPELPYVFEDPAGEGEGIAAFLVFITLEQDELGVDTQSVGFRRLD